MRERSSRLFGMSADVTLFVSLIAAPSIGGSLGTFLFGLGSELIIGRVPDLLSNIRMGLALGFIAGPIFGFPGTFVIGTPMHTLMLRQGLTRAWHYILGGAFIGVINALALALVTGMILNTGVGLLLFGICGAIGGLVFWLARRPDRDAPNASPTP